MTTNKTRHTAPGMSLSRSTLVSATVVALIATGCGRKSSDDGMEVHVAPPQTQVEQSPTANQEVHDESGTSIRVMGSQAISDQKKIGQIESADFSDARMSLDASTPGAAKPELKADSLYIQLPVSLLTHGHLFGGVITKVSDQKSETLGRLKLTDLPPIHVRPYVAVDDTDKSKAAVVLVGCTTKCSETSPQEGLIALPILGQTVDKQALVLDVSKFGEHLDLMAVLDPQGAYSGLVTRSTRTSLVDMSNGTIIWDVEHVMVPKDAQPGSNPETTTITARYYLKLESALNSSFVSRKQISGVGFFTTEHAADELITRFSSTEFNGKPIHYYIKQVPEAYQPAFKKSFDAWNAVFKAEIGRELISYEFVPANDPNNALLVPGDIRFNILEWDLVNVAPYGGLGPSIASQTTGETFSANVLVQGPTIEKLYKEWFKVSSVAQELIAAGRSDEAEALVMATRRAISGKLQASRDLPAQQLRLGSKVKFQHRAQDVRLQDALASRQDFFDLPTGETYDSYMQGYFHDMITHELGHNLGLRHNFRGNLLGAEDGSRPSGSVMEYLNREFRHKDTVGAYDHMAIKYGYAGTKPSRKDMFCTDENVVSAEESKLSAECSRDDATIDPYSYMGTLLARVLEKAVAPQSDAAPTWLISDLAGQINISLTGKISYATSAAKTSAKWTNFKKEGRPTEPAAITKFVIADIVSQLCAPEIRTAPSRKKTEEAKQATIKNLADLDAAVKKLATSFKLADSLTCPATVTR
jgi:hypothetical protein